MEDEVDAKDSFSMVQEAVESYQALPLPDGRTEIRIVIAPRFRNLWLMKLSELRGTTAELRATTDDPGADGRG